MATPRTTKELNVGPALGYDPDFGGLCLDGFPHLLARESDDGEGQFAMPDTSSAGRGSADLKKFLANPDRESIVALRDPELLKRYDRDHGIGETAIVYAANLPFKVFQRDGQWRAKGTTPDGTLHRFSDASRDGVLAKVMEAVKETTVRELTPSQRLEVVRMAQSGNTQGAIARHLEYAIGERGSRYKNPNEMLGDVELAEVFDDAALLSWYSSRSNVQDSEQWNGFLDEYAGGRPYTHALLDGAWSAFEKQQHTSALFAPVREADKPASSREIGKGLEDASDADIEKMMTSTKREFARQALARGR